MCVDWCKCGHVKARHIALSDNQLVLQIPTEEERQQLFEEYIERKREKEKKRQASKEDADEDDREHKHKEKEKDRKRHKKDKRRDDEDSDEDRDHKKKHRHSSSKRYAMLGHTLTGSQLVEIMFGTRSSCTSPKPGTDFLEQRQCEAESELSVEHSNPLETIVNQLWRTSTLQVVLYSSHKHTSALLHL